MMPSSLPLISTSALQAALAAASTAAPQPQETTNAPAAQPTQPQNSFQALVTQVLPQPPHYLLTLLADKHSLQLLSELPLPLGARLTLAPIDLANPPNLRLLALSLPPKPQETPVIKAFLQSRAFLEQTAPRDTTLYQRPTANLSAPSQTAPSPALASTPSPNANHPLLSLLNLLTAHSNQDAKLNSTLAQTQTVEAAASTTKTAINPLASTTTNGLPPAVQDILQAWVKNLPSLAELGQSAALKQTVINSGMQFEHQLWQLLSQVSHTPNTRELFRTLWQQAQNQSASSQPDSAPDNLSPADALLTSLFPRRIGELLQGLKAKLEAPITSQASQTNPASPANAAPTLPSLVQSLLNNDYKAVVGRALLLWAKALAQSGQPSFAELRSLPLSAAPIAQAPEGFKVLHNALLQIEHEQTQRLQSTDTWQMNIPLWYRDGAEHHPFRLHLERDSHSDPKQAAKAQHSWRIRLYFELSHLGQLDIDLRLHQTQLSATFWSTETRTLNLLNHALQPLRSSLSKLGVEVSELQAKHGALPEPCRNRIQRNWINEEV